MEISIKVEISTKEEIKVVALSIKAKKAEAEANVLMTTLAAIITINTLEKA